MEWYYSYGGQTVGPFNEKEMVELIKKGKIKKNTSVRKHGSEEWMFITETFLIHYFENGNTKSKKWFYLQNQVPVGPFEEKEILDLYKKGEINKETTVCKGSYEGDNVKWFKLSETGLLDTE